MLLENKLFLRWANDVISGNKIWSEDVPAPGTVDWKRFTELITYHELYPFLYLPLKESAIPVPEDLRNLLSHNYYRTIMNSTKAWREFLFLAGAFAERNIAVAPLKGIALLADVYRDQPARAMADIDILVKEKEFAIARKLLSKLGYEPVDGGGKEEYWLHQHCELTFAKKQKGGFILDVHFRLDFKRPGTVPLPHLWGRTKKVSIDGRGITLLSPEDQLFCLALHQRRFGGKAFCLKNVFDLAMILKKYGKTFDWNYVVSEARAGKMGATILFILLEAQLFFEAHIPESVWDQLNVPPHKRTLMKYMVEGDAFRLLPHGESKGAYLKTHLLLYDDFWEPIAYLLNIPIEQFAKYYDLDPYSKKTRFLYQIRLGYMLFRTIVQIVEACFALCRGDRRFVI